MQLLVNNDRYAERKHVPYIVISINKQIQPYPSAIFTHNIYRPRNIGVADDDTVQLAGCNNFPRRLRSDVPCTMLQADLHQMPRAACACIRSLQSIWLCCHKNDGQTPLALHTMAVWYGAGTLALLYLTVYTGRKVTQCTHSSRLYSGRPTRNASVFLHVILTMAIIL